MALEIVCSRILPTYAKEVSEEVILMECILEDVCVSSAKHPEWACNEPQEDRMRLCAYYVIMMVQFKGRVFKEIEFQQALPKNKLEESENLE